MKTAEPLCRTCCYPYSFIVLPSALVAQLLQAYSATGLFRTLVKPAPFAVGHVLLQPAPFGHGALLLAP